MKYLVECNHELYGWIIPVDAKAEGLTEVEAEDLATRLRTDLYCPEDKAVRVREDDGTGVNL
jgi:hypothetical protein